VLVAAVSGTLCGFAANPRWLGGEPAFTLVVRWSRAGSGKRGGVRVIHYNQLADGRIYLLLIYAKSAKDNVPANVLLKIKETLHAHDGKKPPKPYLP